MDTSLYKRFTVSRGYEYNYYAVSASDDKPTLLFVHGFPSTSADWRRQVAYFKAKGYGLIVPDLLGYGHTAKPLEPEAYVYHLLAKDLVELVEAEGVAKAIAIGHDWFVLGASHPIWPDQLNVPGARELYPTWPTFTKTASSGLVSWLLGMRPPIPRRLRRCRHG